jgi:hypothetical protein
MKKELSVGMGLPFGPLQQVGVRQKNGGNKTNGPGFFCLRTREQLILRFGCVLFKCNQIKNHFASNYVQSQF